MSWWRRTRPLADSGSSIVSKYIYTLFFYITNYIFVFRLLQWHENDNQHQPRQQRGTTTMGHNSYVPQRRQDTTATCHVNDGTWQRQDTMATCHVNNGTRQRQDTMATCHVNNGTRRLCATSTTGHDSYMPRWWRDSFDDTGEGHWQRRRGQTSLRWWGWW
jgi:hypothetical protein